MDQKRQGEIARAIVKAIAKHVGPKRMLKATWKLDKVAEATEVDLAEVQTFVEILNRELTKDWFTEK